MHLPQTLDLTLDSPIPISKITIQLLDKDSTFYSLVAFQTTTLIFQPAEKKLNFKEFLIAVKV